MRQAIVEKVETELLLKNKTVNWLMFDEEERQLDNGKVCLLQPCSLFYTKNAIW